MIIEYPATLRCGYGGIFVDTGKGRSLWTAIAQVIDVEYGSIVVHPTTEVFSGRPTQSFFFGLIIEVEKTDNYMCRLGVFRTSVVPARGVGHPRPRPLKGSQLRNQEVDPEYRRIRHRYRLARSTFGLRPTFFRFDRP